MVDTERGVQSEDRELYRMVQKKEKILVINKKDLLKGLEKINIPEGWAFNDVVYTSVKFNQGIDALMETIHRFGTEGWQGSESDIVPNLRQKILFEKALGAVNKVLCGVEENTPQELAVLDLKDAMDALDEISGTTVRADILDTVFSRFCIGK
jgi:tRNA modification GTPase